MRNRDMRTWKAISRDLQRLVDEERKAKTPMEKDLHPVTGKPFYYTCQACKTRHFTGSTPTLADRNGTSFRAYYCAKSQHFTPLERHDDATK